MASDGPKLPEIIAMASEARAHKEVKIPALLKTQIPLVAVLMIVFGLSSSARTDEPPAPGYEKRTSADAYFLWRVAVEHFNTQSPKESSRAPLRLVQYTMPDLGVKQVTIVRFKDQLDIAGMSHWGKSLVPAGIPFQDAKAILRDRLPESKVVEKASSGLIVAGVLSASPSMILAFVYAANTETSDCGMGLTKYRLMDLHTNHTFLDRDFCFHNLRGECSGFVAHSVNLCYIATRSVALSDGDQPQLKTTVMALRKDGALQATNISADMLFAKPDQSEVAIIKFSPTLKNLRIQLYDAGLGVRTWMATVPLRNEEEIQDLEVFWSLDSRILCVCPCDGDSNSRLVLLNGADGTVLAERQCPFGSLVNMAAVALVPKSLNFSVSEYFMLKPGR